LANVTKFVRLDPHGNCSLLIPTVFIFTLTPDNFIMTHVLAFCRLMSATKTRLRSGTALLLVFLLLTALAKPVAQAQSAPVNFPVPQRVPNQLFYLQRDPNVNTVMYTLNVKDGKLVTNDPVHAYWIRYAEDNHTEELNYIQKTFAYGLKSRSLGNGQYDLNFVSYKKLSMRLARSERDNNYYVYANVNQKKIQLKRIYVRVEGGTMWVPNVRYIQLEGINTATGENIIERIPISMKTDASV
jgi:hypothetical protein